MIPKRFPIFYLFENKLFSARGLAAMVPAPTATTWLKPPGPREGSEPASGSRRTDLNEDPEEDRDETLPDDDRDE